MNKVYVRWNPLYERVVCVHTNEEDSCSKCVEENKSLEDYHYSLEGEWFDVDIKPLTRDVDVIDEAYQNYLKNVVWMSSLDQLGHGGVIIGEGGGFVPFTKEEFTNKIKIDIGFCDRWDVYTEITRIYPRKRTVLALEMGIELSKGHKSSSEWDIECDEKNIPKKLITITYNDNTVEFYE